MTSIKSFFKISLSALPLLAALPSSASITVRLALSPDFAAAQAGVALDEADTNTIPSNVGAAWHRYHGMKALRDGKITGAAEGCANNVDQNKNIPFSTATGREVGESYVVYGKAEKFVVPADGAYEISANTDVATILFIDGKEVDGGTSKMKFFPGGSIGTPISTDSKKWSSSVELTAGDHALEFIYFSSHDYSQSRCVLSWKKPGDAAAEVIPASAFGEANCASSSLNKTAFRSHGGNGFAFNAVGDALMFSRPLQGEVALQFFNLEGKQVWSTKALAEKGSQAVRLKGMPMDGGLYLVRASGSGLSGTALLPLRK